MRRSPRVIAGRPGGGQTGSTNAEVLDDEPEGELDDAPDVEPMPGQWWVELFDVLPDEVLPDEVLPDEVLPDEALLDVPLVELDALDVVWALSVAPGLVLDAPETSIPAPRLNPSVPATTPAATIG